MKIIFLRFFIIHTLLIVFFTKLKAQSSDIRFSHINRENGLVDNSIFSIYPDKRGFIWFGSHNGLNRYDGYRFYEYKKQFNKLGGLQTVHINYINEDKKNNLWIATNNGICLYNLLSDKITQFIYNSNNTTLNPAVNQINHFVESPKGYLWLATAAGLASFQTDQKKYRTYFYKKNNKLDFNTINCIYMLNEELLWLGSTNYGILFFNTRTKKFVDLNKNFSQLNQLKFENIKAIAKNKDGNIWIGTQNKGVYRFNPDQNKLVNYTSGEKSNQLSSDAILSILCDHKGNVWIGTENGGISLWKPNTGNFMHYQYSLLKPNSLSQNSILALAEDQQHNIWVAAQKGGLNLYSPNLSRFTTITAEYGENALSFKDVKALNENTNGNILIGTDGGGLNIWNREANTFKHFRNEKNNPQSISSDYVLAIAKDKKEQVWLGTWDKGLNLFNSKTGNFIRYKNTQNLSANYIMDLHADEGGLIWIATYGGGLNVFDPVKKTFKRIKQSVSSKDSIRGDRVVSIYQDKETNLWIGLEDGELSRIYPDRERIKSYYFYDAHVYFSDYKKRLWLGKTGLYQWDKKNDKFIQFKTNSLLDSVKIQGIIEDDKGNLWVTTISGLVIFNPDTKYIRRYTTADGLQGLEFNLNTNLKTKDGKLLFGGTLGFNIVAPNKPIPKPETFPIYITDFQIFNKSINADPNSSTLQTNIFNAKKVTLSYQESMFSFEYAALNFATQPQTNYAYLLKGFDKNWNYVGAQRKATYTNLNPGEYTFYVKAKVKDGNWNSTPATIQVIVKPAFWMTWWFKSISILLGLVIIFIILYYRRKAELKLFKNQQKVELQQFQLEFFFNISHELRTPLSLILGSLEQVQKTTLGNVAIKYIDRIKRNSNRLMHLINELMDYRKAEIGTLTLNVNEGNFNQFLKEVSNDFIELAEFKEIEYHIIQQVELVNVWFDDQIFEKILLNLIHNSFKYTQTGGTITIETLASLENFKPLYEKAFIKIEHDYKAQKNIYLSICDSGIGIDGESIKHVFDRYYRVSDQHIGSGIGLAFVKTLINLYRGSISVYSEKQKGTQIIIAIPCSKNDFSRIEITHEPSGSETNRLESLRYKYPTEISGMLNELNYQTEKPNISKEIILIVEDNTELRTHYREVLEPFYQILEAENGEEGLKIATEKSPSLIISDVMMPLLDGIEFCKRIKENFETSHIPLILLTAKDALEFKIEGMKSGADHYLSKPLNNDVLILTVKNLFKQRTLLKERYQQNYQMEVHDLVHSEKDKAFINRLLEIINQKIDDTNLNVEYICREIGISKTPLYKKIKEITGENIVEFIRNVRLKKAIEIMTTEDVLITEVINRVGIQSLSYFASIFKKKFGVTPSQFQQQLDEKIKQKTKVV